MILPDDQLEKLVLDNNLISKLDLEGVKSFAKDIGLPLYQALVEKGGMSALTAGTAYEVAGSTIANSIDLCPSIMPTYISAVPVDSSMTTKTPVTTCTRLMTRGIS